MNDTSFFSADKPGKKRPGIGFFILFMNIVNMTAVALLTMGIGFVVLSDKLELAGVSVISIIKLDLLILLCIIPLGILTYFIINRRFIKPISMMAQFLRGFVNTTDQDRRDYARTVHDIPVDITQDNELSDLYNSIVVMAEQTTEYISRIKEEKRLEEELVAAKAASSAKTSFLSNMSHEIRTPINSVLGMDEMILRESKEPGTLRYAQNIQEAGKALLSLINDILDFSRIEAGKMEINPVEYDLSSVINDIINMITLKTREKGLQLYVKIDETTPHVLLGDEYRIRQCILNLMTNAVKYTPKGNVELKISYYSPSDPENKSTDNEGDEVCITVDVKDTGVGIRKEDISRLFSPFDRLGEDKNPGSVGTGLGLSIVQQLLHLMGSELNVESTFGEGSRFYFTIRQRVVNWDPIGDFSDTYEKSAKKRIDYREAFHAPNARILVVDDTEMNLTVVKGLLKQTMITVDTASSGQEMLEKVCEKRYDIIFLDHRMPVMDGIEAFHRMQALDNNLNRDVPCIALTANAISGARERYFAEGFSDYMSKPIEGTRLEKLVLKYLAPELIEVVEIDPGEVEDNSRTIPEIEGIDHSKAIKHCGSEAVLEKIMRQFLGLIPGKAEEIQSYWEIGDYNNLGIQVHSLKSTSRLIGASELSAKAEQLENAANEHDRYYIDANCGEFLEQYRAFADKLSFLREKKDTADKPLMEERQIQEILQGMREFIDAFDFDGADDLFEMSKAYRLPMEITPLFEKIEASLAAVDREGLLELLDSATRE